jgi:succinoglycan biosynthesis transport protein ExoP
MQPQPAAYSPDTDLDKGVEGQLDLVSLLRILRRRKWLIVAMLVLGTGAGFVGSQAITPRYSAKALVMLEAREARITDIPAVVGDLFDDPANVDAHLETQIRLMVSRSTMAEVIAALNLASDPEFHPPPPEETEVALFGETWLRLLPWVPPSWAVTAENAGEAKTAPAGTEPDAAAPTADAVTTPAADRAAKPDLEHVFDRFAQSLSVAPEGRSFVIGVSFSSNDAQKAATIANKVVDVYIEKQRAMKRESTAARRAHGQPERPARGGRGEGPALPRREPARRGERDRSFR